MKQCTTRHTLRARLGPVAVSLAAALACVTLLATALAAQPDKAWVVQAGGFSHDWRADLVFETLATILPDPDASGLRIERHGDLHVVRAGSFPDENAAAVLLASVRTRYPEAVVILAQVADVPVERRPGQPSVSSSGQAEARTEAADSPAPAATPRDLVPADETRVSMARAAFDNVHTLQVGSYSDKDEADKVFRRLDGMLPMDEVDALRVELVGKYYAVRVGAYADKAGAEALRDRVAGAFPGATPMTATIPADRVLRFRARSETSLPMRRTAAPAPVAASSASVPAAAPAAPETPADTPSQAPATATTAPAPVTAEPRAPAPMADAAPHTPGVDDSAGRRLSIEELAALHEKIEVHPLLYSALATVALLVVLFMLRPRSSRKKAKAVRVDAALGDEPRDPPMLAPADEAMVARNFRELSNAEGNILSQGKDLRTIYVTSCFDREGKTTASVGLAHALAAHGQARVLLMDCNPLGPRLHAMFGMGERMGLSDLLHTDNGLEDALVTTGYPNLTVMPYGHPAPDTPKLLRGEPFRRVISSVRERFDYVVCDGHSLLSSSEASIISDYFDGIILTVECEKTKWEVVQMASEKVTVLGGKLLGIALNKRRYYIPRFLYGKI